MARVFLGLESMFCFGVAAAWQSPVLTTGQSRGHAGHSQFQSTKAATEVTSVWGECDRVTPCLFQVGSDDCGKYRMCWFVCVFSLRPSAHRGAVGAFPCQSIPRLDFLPVCAGGLSTSVADLYFSYLSFWICHDTQLTNTKS